MASTATVRVGIGCFITSPQHPSCILLGVRKGSHGEGKLAVPGGHLELGESWEDCAIREVKEETNLDIENLNFIYATNDPNIDNKLEKHYITLFMYSTISSTSSPLELLEPHKCESWNWVSYQELHDIMKNKPELLFDPMLHFLQGKGAQLLESYL